MAYQCKQCNKAIFGRSDKQFCSVACKNAAHNAHRRAAINIVQFTDAILHRNRSILEKLMDKKATQMEVDRLVLDHLGFNFKYCTGIFTNSKGNLYFYIYDYAWTELSKQQVLFVTAKKEL